VFAAKRDERRTRLLGYTSSLAHHRWIKGGQLVLSPAEQEIVDRREEEKGRLLARPAARGESNQRVILGHDLREHGVQRRTRELWNRSELLSQLHEIGHQHNIESPRKLSSCRGGGVRANAVAYELSSRASKRTPEDDLERNVIPGPSAFG
jgi:hypothetical protein